MSKFTRDIWWIPAFDKRPKNPGDPNYGVHGMELSFVLRCPEEGAGLLWNIMTNWQLPEVQQEWKNEGVTSLFMPLPASLSLHKLALLDAPQSAESCSVVHGPCAVIATTYLTQDLFDKLVREGIEPLWKMLEERYESWMVEANST